MCPVRPRVPAPISPRIGLARHVPGTCLVKAFWSVTEQREHVTLCTPGKRSERCPRGRAVAVRAGPLSAYVTNWLETVRPKGNPGSRSVSGLSPHSVSICDDFILTISLLAPSREIKLTWLQSTLRPCARTVCMAHIASVGNLQLIHCLRAWRSENCDFARSRPQ